MEKMQNFFNEEQGHQNTGVTSVCRSKGGVNLVRRTGLQAMSVQTVLDSTLARVTSFN